MSTEDPQLLDNAPVDLRADEIDQFSKAFNSFSDTAPASVPVENGDSQPAEATPVSSPDVVATPIEPAQKPGVYGADMTFKDAFRAARKAGLANFTWGGKPGMRYTTELRVAPKSATLPNKQTEQAPVAVEVPKRKLRYESAAERGARFSYADAQAAYDRAHP